MQGCRYPEVNRLDNGTPGWDSERHFVLTWIAATAAPEAAGLGIAPGAQELQPIDPHHRLAALLTGRSSDRA